MGIFHQDYGLVTGHYGWLWVTGELWVKKCKKLTCSSLERMGPKINQKIRKQSMIVCHFFSGNRTATEPVSAIAIYCHENLFKAFWARDLERLVVSVSGPLPEGIYIPISSRLLTTHHHSLGWKMLSQLVVLVVEAAAFHSSH